MYFAGWTISCLIIPRISDLYGRKIMTLTTVSISTLIYLGLILSKNLDLSIALLFFYGLMLSGKTINTYVYLLELVPKKYQAYVGTVFLFADGTTTIWISLYFRYISKNWIWF